MLAKTIDILMVEDNPGDIRLTKEAFTEAKIRNNINVVRDSAEALDYLHRREKYENVKRPDLILLDLNLPKKHGLEVLEDIKKDPVLRRIPVVVLTSSTAEEDILTSYNLYANCYIAKPIEIKQLVHIVKSIEHFWLEIVELPPE